MGNLRIKKVVYSGRKYFFESEIFDKNIVLIEGDNGTGKSTFCNLIYFGLGGRVNEFKHDSDKKHKEITSDTDNYIELYIEVNGENFLLRRFLSENDITVTPFIETVVKGKKRTLIQYSALEKAEETKVYAIFRREQEPFTFSDWILGKLGITVVELYQGYATFKVNFSDLMRLIYHDQQPDPEFIYKKLDMKSNFVSDSETLRKAIFELLVGKAFSEFYEAIIESKKAEKDKLLAKSLVDEYTTLADKIRGREELKNKSFLQEEIRVSEGQLEKLHAARKAFKRNRDTSLMHDPEIGFLKNMIMEIELELSDKQEALVGLYDERYKLVAIKNGTVREVGQLQKVIHTHDHLNLFAPNTCPYCLTKVDRPEGHCVCGAPIEEEQYERFFYTSQEYNEILKAKTKSLTTIELAISGCNEDIFEITDRQKSLAKTLTEQKKKLHTQLEAIDQTIDLETINDIDDKILEVREQIAHLDRTIGVETKLESLQKSYDEKRQLATDLELMKKELAAKAQRDIAKKVNKFSEIYNSFMIETLPDCRSARIRLEDYMPSINDGEYREASARVSMRLMYYLSLMKLSLVQEDVTFPKFLLVDTPETAGIEIDNLINCIGKFEELELLGHDFQVILATGLKKYPPSLQNNRVIYMPTKSDGLLQPR